MNDTLKKVDREGAQGAGPGRGGDWKTNLRRSAERLETQFRLWLRRQRRMALLRRENAAKREQAWAASTEAQAKREQARTAASAEAQAKREQARAASAEAQAKREQARTAASAEAQAKREQRAAVSAAMKAARRTQKQERREAVRYAQEEPEPQAAPRPRLSAQVAPDAPLRERAAGVGQALKAEAQRIRRRWHHIRREQKAQRFPESNRAPVQAFLMLGGLIPMLSGKLAERLRIRRKHAVHRSAGLRAWLEGKRIHPAAFFAAAVGIAAVAVFCSTYTFGTTVIYNGQVVANVTSEMAAKGAVRDLESVTRSTLGGSYTISDSTIQYANGLMSRQEVVDGETFEAELSENIGLVTYGYALYVDGELIGATPYEGALEELLQQLKDGASGENTISCDFQEEVEVKAGYVATEQVMNLGYIAEMLYSTKTEEVTYTVKSGDTWSEIAEDHGMTSSELLAMNPGYNINKLQIGEVLTLSAAVPYLTLTVVQQERYVDEVNFDIVYTDTADLYKGDYKVTSAGEYGAADVVANVTYVNGEETERTVLSSVTLKEPVTEHRLQGTKERPTWYPTGTFRWPTTGRITSRFGYRTSPGGIGSTNHKGIDIAGSYGTPIYAADGGTVVYAGWMSGYGYLVQIDHGNGYVTYYGHNSSLIVSVGQHVYKGQQIARMGSTGNSTGNHCHFEVRYNGVPKNPLNYLP